MIAICTLLIYVYLVVVVVTRFFFLPIVVSQFSRFAIVVLSFCISLLSSCCLSSACTIQVASLTEPLVRVPYPAAAEEGSAASTSQGPVKLSFALPPHVVLAEKAAPRLATWSAEHRAWRSDGIALLGYDAIKRMVHVQVVALAPFAIIQPRMLDYPYKRYAQATKKRKTFNFPLNSLLNSLLFVLSLALFFVWVRVFVL